MLKKDIFNWKNKAHPYIRSWGLNCSFCCLCRCCHGAHSNVVIKTRRDQLKTPVFLWSSNNASVWSGGVKCAKFSSVVEADSPRVLLERRLRWLVEVLWGNRVFCWWLLSMGLVAMMLSLYLFIRANLVLSFTADQWDIITNRNHYYHSICNEKAPTETPVSSVVLMF